MKMILLTFLVAHVVQSNETPSAFDVASKVSEKNYTTGVIYTKRTTEIDVAEFIDGYELINDKEYKRLIIMKDGEIIQFPDYGIDCYSGHIDYEAFYQESIITCRNKLKHFYHRLTPDVI